MENTTALEFDYKWNADEETVAKLTITDKASEQVVIISDISGGRYSFTSRLLGDMVAQTAERTFSLSEALYYAMVSLGVLPPVNLPQVVEV